LTRGRAAAPDPFDIGAVNRSGELFDALAARRLADPGDDPTARLLAALVADVDMGAPPLPAPARLAYGKSGSRRRVVRAVVTLGVTAAVLTTAGAAAAGGGGGGDGGADGARAPHSNLSERTNGSLKVNSPERFIGRSLTRAVPRAVDKHGGDGAHKAHRSGAEERHGSRHDHDADVTDSTPELQDSGDRQKDAITPTVTPSPGPTISPPHLKEP
jgi:hypothetical protein